MRGNWVQSLAWEDRLEEGMVTHPSIFAWRIPWTGAWWTAVPGVEKSRTQLSNEAQHTVFETCLVRVPVRPLTLSN